MSLPALFIVGDVSRQSASAAKRASYAKIFASPRKKRFYPAANMAIFALPGTL
jgi:hypothetical protein